MPHRLSSRRRFSSRRQFDDDSESCTSVCVEDGDVSCSDGYAGSSSSGEEECSSACSGEESLSSEEEDSDYSFSGEESSGSYSENDIDVGSVLDHHPASMNHYRENDYSSSSSDETTNTSLDGDGVGHQKCNEESSGDESTNEADDGSAKQLFDLVLRNERHVYFLT